MKTVGTAMGDILRDLTGNAKDKHNILELLRFFGRKPNTRFNRQAIIRIANSAAKTEKALKYLVSKGAVRECNENDSITYSLTDQGWMHSLAKDLATLDWSQYYMTLKQILQPSNESN
jgi:predicted transcriptional regulator